MRQKDERHRKSTGTERQEDKEIEICVQGGKLKNRRERQKRNKTTEKWGLLAWAKECDTGSP